MNAFDLNGRVAVVTGGARGICRGITDRLIASGAKVSVWDLRAPESPAEGLHSLIVDMTDPGAVARAAEVTLAQHGKVDILVNGAGIAGPAGPVEDLDPAKWRQVIAVNLDSAFLACRALIPAMRGRGYGRIISVASVAGKEGNPGLAAYSAAKAGLIGFTKAVARELATTGILVNCITPGLVRTALLDELSDEAITLYRSKIPLDRVGTVEEVAAMVTWIASEECSFTTGAAFDLSGGRSSY